MKKSAQETAKLVGVSPRKVEQVRTVLEHADKPVKGKQVGVSHWHTLRPSVQPGTKAGGRLLIPLDQLGLLRFSRAVGAPGLVPGPAALAPGGTGQR